MTTPKVPSRLHRWISACYPAESLLPAVAFLVVLLTTVFVWVPYSREAEGPLTSTSAAGTLTDAGLDLKKKAVQRIANAHRERRALGCEDPPDVLVSKAQAAVKAAKKPQDETKTNTPPAKVAGEEVALSGTGNWRAASLLALTFTLLSLIVTLVVAVYGLRRMRVALKGVVVLKKEGEKEFKTCNCRWIFTAVLAVLGSFAVYLLPGRLGFLGVPSVGIDLGWGNPDASANLVKALGNGSLLGSLMASRGAGPNAFLHVCGGVALCVGYGAAIILVGAFGASIVRARQAAKEHRKAFEKVRYQRGDPNGTTEEKATYATWLKEVVPVRRNLMAARVVIREGSADPKSILYASGALFAAGMLAHATYRSAAVAFLPSNRTHLQSCVDALAQTETFCIALVYTLFLAATYYMAASLIARRDRFLSNQISQLPSGSSESEPQEPAAQSKLDVLGILKRLLVVVAPVVASLLVELLKVITAA
jgi:hypothetical protein